MKKRILLLVVCVLICSGTRISTAVEVSELHGFNVETFAAGLGHPWSLVFLPGGDALVSERHGHLRRVHMDGTMSGPLAGLPPVREIGQGGLLGITLHPDFHENGRVYLSLVSGEHGLYGTEVFRARLYGDALLDVESIFRALPKSRGGRHFGSRLVFDTARTLYVSLGDRGEMQSAQDPDDHRGSLIRITDEGTVPGDNPFIGLAGTRPEIFTIGHRNIQGMALHPATGAIWIHEHGPQGGDEINVIRPGSNYGWPVITYGVNYGTGTPIGSGTHREGMEQPVYKWVPSIAPSGMTFYQGRQFPGWQGNLFVGSLKFGLLVRLTVEGDRIVAEERLLQGKYGRIRDVVTGPDDYLYLLTDETDGRILRLTPYE